MRVLFLTDPAPDYLADLLYIGLYRVLGMERVVDFPLKPAFHHPQSRVHYIPQVPAHAYRDEDILAMVRDRQFDLTLLSSPRPGVVSAFDSLSRRVSMPPLVLVDGEDDASMRHDVWTHCKPVLYFKRELKRRLACEGTELWRDWFGARWPRPDLSRVYPLPLCVALEQVPPVHPCERVVDVSYTARVSHPKRKRAVDLLAGADGIRFEGGLYAEANDRRSKLLTGLPRLWTKLKGDPRLSPAERGMKLTPEAYYVLLAKSKMALSVRGGGFDTLRYWEIVATKTLLLSEQPDIDIPNNFEHGRHALFFKPDLSDLSDLVRTYAKDESACRMMAQQGYEHLLRYHTCERRAEYLLETCRRLL